MDKQFFSQNNYIALKEIISSIAGVSFNNKEEDRKLYEHMVKTFDTTDTDNFHDLNKKCIGLYTNRFERQIPVNNERDDKNIINPVQSSIQNNTIEPSDLIDSVESIKTDKNIEEEDPNDLFAKLKQERDNAYEIQSSNQNYERPVNSIQDDLQESFQNGQNLNQFHDMDRSTHNFSSDNLMNNNSQDNDLQNDNSEFDTIIQNSIDKTDILGESKILSTEDENVLNTLNPYSYFQQGAQSKEQATLFQRDVIIVIDSRDRDLELYPNTNHYQVKFSGGSDTIEIPTHLNENGVVVHETATLYKAYQGANINIVLKNVKYIELVNVTIPYTPVYHNGNPPVYYTDENQSAGNRPGAGPLSILPTNFVPNFIPGPTGSTPLLPNSAGATGIPLDILDEPYLLIYVDEIDTQSWYRSTNPETEEAFARVMNPSIMSSHTNASYAMFAPRSVSERMAYEPTLLASLDKMTLRIKDSSNDHIDVGQDKMYVKEINQSAGKIINRCFASDKFSAEAVVRGTDIVITTEHFDYRSEGCTNNIINNHCLRPGDTVFFYDTRPCDNEFIYKLNKEQTYLKYSDTKKTFEIKYKYNTTTKNNKNVTERILSLSQYLFIGDFIAVGGMLFKISNFDGKNAIIEEADRLRYHKFISQYLTNGLKDGTNNYQVGFVKQNKKGFTSNNRCALNSKKGHKVLYIYDAGITSPDGTDLYYSQRFTIDLPWDKISGNYMHYKEDTVFFIKKGLQTSYMFKFSMMEKQNEQLNPELV